MRARDGVLTDEGSLLSLPSALEMLAEGCRRGARVAIYVSGRDSVAPPQWWNGRERLRVAEQSVAGRSEGVKGERSALRLRLRASGLPDPRGLAR